MDAEQKKIEEIEEMIISILHGLLGKEEKCEVKSLSGGRTTVFEISVPKAKVGQIIGKGGRNADAIRNLVTAAAAGKEVKRRISIEILD